MTWEVMDVSTEYAMGEDAILANFTGRGKATTDHSGGDHDDEANAASRCSDKKKDKKCHGEEMLAVATHTTRSYPKGKG